jgi:hypothetical protein
VAVERECAFAFCARRVKALRFRFLEKMSFVNSLELRFGRFAIPGLIRIIVAFNALVFVLYKLNPEFLSVLELSPARVLHGEVWRLVTYIFIPRFGAAFMPDWFALLMYLWFLWFVGDGLEQAMGAFRLNLFYFLGMLGVTIAAFFFDDSFSNAMLNTSLFLAFARFYPDLMIYLFYVLPVRIKWLAWFYGATLLLGLVTGSNSYRMALIAAFTNYLIFFGPEIYREARMRKSVGERRRRFERDTGAHEEQALHTCAVCQRTEITDPQLDFRVSKDGNEYCIEHLPKRTDPATAR